MTWMLWKKHIDEELIDIFLQRLFEHYGNSLFDFEDMIKNYGLSGDRPKPIEDDECIKSCEAVGDLLIDIDGLNSEIKLLKEKVEDQRKRKIEKGKDSIRNLELYNEMKEKYETLKKNSVLFTMDEGEF